MHIELNPVQQLGMGLALAGLLLNNVLIVYSYFRIKGALKANGVKPDAFPLLAFYFQLRMLIRTLISRKKQKKYRRILIFLNGSMLTTVCMIVTGLLILVM
jgi:hypothetical protein